MMDAADLLPDPLAQFARWLEDARAAGLELPEAMTLATADGEGRPSARTVLLKGVDADGFRFFTNTESRKAGALAGAPQAARVFPWPLEPRRQGARRSRRQAPPSRAYRTRSGRRLGRFCQNSSRLGRRRYPPHQGGSGGSSP